MCTSTIFLGIASADHIAPLNISRAPNLDLVIAEAFIRILNTSEYVTSVLASVGAYFNGVCGRCIDPISKRSFVHRILVTRDVIPT